jgi:hypothetical protein
MGIVLGLTNMTGFTKSSKGTLVLHSSPVFGAAAAVRIAALTLAGVHHCPGPAHAEAKAAISSGMSSIITQNLGAGLSSIFGRNSGGTQGGR